MEHNNCKAACHEKEKEISFFRDRVLSWYDRHRRVLPWRALKGEKLRPYHVWLSEIMLQQTTVPTVMPYFLKFIDLWPDLKALADAQEDDVLSAWAGLGYYARARNLHKCAQILSKDYGGVFPADQKSLKKLPGIGDYTSAAIRSIAFDKPATVVDGNVERIMARHFAITTPLPAAKKALHQQALILSEGRTDRPGDYAQSLMDIGSSVCIAGKPRCSLCPLVKTCLGKADGIAEVLPKRTPKKAKPQKTGYVFWISDKKGHILLHKRPAKGLFASMVGLPTTNWLDKNIKPTAHEQTFEIPLPFLDLKKGNERCLFVEHVFTHFSLKLFILEHTISEEDNNKIVPPFFWHDVKDVENTGFPSLFRKVVNLCLR